VQVLLDSDFIPAQMELKPTERFDWVEMQLARHFMLDTHRSMLASLLVTWLLAVALYSAAPLVDLLIWLMLINATILFRYLVIFQYRDKMQGVIGSALRDFLSRYHVLWTMSGALWGASSYLFFGKASDFEQLICGLILIGVSCFSVYAYASRLSCFFSFSNALTGTILAVLIYESSAAQAAPMVRDGMVLAALVLVFHLLIRYFAIRFHDLQRKSLQLQFDNAALIKSLTQKNLAAVEAVENKNRFIASAAHDLRQPVHALNLYASWLVDEPQLGSKVAPQIVRCTNAVNELFNSLFDYSGLNADVPQVQWQQVDLAELLVDLQSQYAPLAQAHGLDIRLRLGVGSVASDPVLLKRLLGNLISNALKNTRQGGVLLALRWRAGQWRIEVRDTGIGIEPKYQQAIFKEFYRVPRQGTEDGFGLGLTIASRLSQLLGVTLHMRSRPGSGSVFWIEQTDSALLSSLPDKALAP
jgi:signal transduction histidine kinase